MRPSCVICCRLIVERLAENVCEQGLGKKRVSLLVVLLVYSRSVRSLSIKLLPEQPSVLVGDGSGDLLSQRVIKQKRFLHHLGLIPPQSSYSRCGAPPGPTMAWKPTYPRLFEDEKTAEAILATSVGLPGSSHSKTLSGENAAQSIRSKTSTSSIRCCGMAPMIRLR